MPDTPDTPDTPEMPDTRMGWQALFGARGRTAVITGGSGQLGGAMASTLARAGARVAILARNAEASNTVAEAIRQAGGVAIAAACDVLDRAALERSREQVLSDLGPAAFSSMRRAATLPPRRQRPTILSSIWTPTPSTACWP